MLKTILRTPAASVALFAVAAALLLGGSIGAVQAAPRLVSDSYLAEVELASIDTALVENGATVPGDGALLAGLAASGEPFRIGARYDEQLAVQNTGSIDEYVRLTVTRYWTDAAGKAVDLDPALIELGLAQGGGWTVDEDASTPERTVLYYAEPLAPGQATTAALESLTVSGDVLLRVTEAADGTDAFDYEGVQFHVKAVADAVQARNGEEAMVGAWGRTV